MPKPKTKSTTKPKPKTARPSPRPRASQNTTYRLRRSRVHGTGLFAVRTIVKGERIIEYLGERISHEEADRRHEGKADDDNHTLLFTIDAKTVIDGAVGGNDARFINHSCDPNCEVILVDGRPIVEVVRTAHAGEELAYDYNLTRAPEDSPEIERIFACKCGAPTCRGTMLAPLKKPKAAAKAPSKRSATKTKRAGTRPRSDRRS